MTEPLITISLKRDDIKISDRKAVVKRLLKNLLTQKIEQVSADIDIDNDSLVFDLTPPCGCMEMSMPLDDIPLEDLSCKCGQYKLIKYVFE